MVSWIKKKGGVNGKCYHTVWLSCTYHYYNLIKTLGLQGLGKRTIEQHLNGDIILIEINMTVKMALDFGMIGTVYLTDN